jgi:hypothetical protein
MKTLNFYELHDLIPFGKYKSSFLKDIIDKDPQYIDWALRNISDFLIDDFAKEYLQKIKRDREALKTYNFYSNKTKTTQQPTNLDPSYFGIEPDMGGMWQPDTPDTGPYSPVS